MGDIYEDKDSRTIFCGNISEQASEELLYELFLQAGPLEEVSLPKGKDGVVRPFAFVTYMHKMSVPYAIQLFRGTRLFHRELNLQARCPQIKLQMAERPQLDRGFVNQQQSSQMSQEREKPWMRQSSNSYKQHSRRDDRQHKPYERNRSPPRSNNHRYREHDDRRYAGNRSDDRRRR